MVKMKALAPEKFKEGFGKVDKGKPVAPSNPSKKGAVAALKKAQAPQAKKASRLAKVPK